MCNKAVEFDPSSLQFVPDIFKTQDMCDKALEADPWSFEYAPDHFKTQDMCEKEVKKAIRPEVFSQSLEDTRNV